MTNQEIELIAKNDKYINYCKKHTDYDDVLWKDLHQEMMIRVIENKEKVKEGGAKYLQKLKEENPEKLREYWRRAYQNRKLKILSEQIKTEIH